MSLQSRVPIPHLGRALRIYSLLALSLVGLTLAARWGGLGAAIFTSVASVPPVDYFLFEPVGHLELASRPMIQFILVLLAGLLLGWVLDNLRAARERAEAATE